MKTCALMTLTRLLLLSFCILILQWGLYKCERLLKRSSTRQHIGGIWYEMGLEENQKLTGPINTSDFRPPFIHLKKRDDGRDIRLLLILWWERQKKRIGSRESRKNVEIYDLINHFSFSFFRPAAGAQQLEEEQRWRIYTRHWWPKGYDQKTRRDWEREDNWLPFDTSKKKKKVPHLLKQEEKMKRTTLEHKKQETGELDERISFLFFFLLKQHTTTQTFGWNRGKEIIRRKWRRKKTSSSFRPILSSSFPCVAAGASAEKLHSLNSSSFF